jgi:peptidoglycan/LPS O-acetylase OafA/YrhL
MWPRFLADVISNGFIGVSFFFVLSGFILAYSYSSRIRNSGDVALFWWARAARILPAYFLAFLVFLPFAIYAVLESAAPRSAAVNALAIASFQLTLTQAWLPGAALAWNSPAWSLSVEACFYALFPFLLPRMEKLSSRTLAIAAVTAYVVSQSLAWAIWKIGPATAASYIVDASRFPPQNPEANDLFYMYFPLLRIPEFIFGVAIGLIFVRRPTLTRLWRRAFIATGILGFVLGFAAFEGHVPAPLVSNGVLMPFLGLLLFGLARSQSRVWNHRTFVQLGDASYSLYLLHIPIFVWLTAIDSRMFHLHERSFTTFFVVYLAIVIGLSLLSLTYIEKPSRLYIKRRFSRASPQPFQSSNDLAGA